MAGESIETTGTDEAVVALTDLVAWMIGELVDDPEQAEVSGDRRGNHIAIRLELPEPSRSAAGINGEIIHVDRFGNLVTNIPGSWLVTSAGAETAAGTGLRIGEGLAPLVKTYTDVEAGRLLAYEGSAGLIEIGMRDGNAAAQTGLYRGASVTAEIGE